MFSQVVDINRPSVMLVIQTYPSMYILKTFVRLYMHTRKAEDIILFISINEICP